MRRTIWVTSIALLLSLSICITSRLFVGRAVDHARHLRTQAIEAMDVRDAQLAEQVLVELAGYLNDNEFWLEFLCQHDDLHEIKEHLIDAQASIEFGIIDDFYQAIYRFGENLEHIAEVEAIRLSNLY